MNGESNGSKQYSEEARSAVVIENNISNEKFMYPSDVKTLLKKPYLTFPLGHVGEDPKPF